ncbi:hypothetical protein [Cylindrospermum stagnale]|uniref:hypothetical protein n=1 Tax=Cylindrospermum stagnale TaxID=142864 RepID=UPI0002F12E2F|nr:hypothetical protein [Cylindrospermum stagnale]
MTGKNLQPIHKELRLGNIRQSLADNTALTALEWSPTTSICEGLAELLKTTQKCFEVKNEQNFNGSYDS